MIRFLKALGRWLLVAVVLYGVAVFVGAPADLMSWTDLQRAALIALSAALAFVLAVEIYDD